MKEPQKNPQILSAGEAKRLLTMAGKLQVRVLLSIGCPYPTSMWSIRCPHPSLTSPIRTRLRSLPAPS